MTIVIDPKEKRDACQMISMWLRATGYDRAIEISNNSRTDFHEDTPPSVANRIELLPKYFEKEVYLPNEMREIFAKLQVQLAKEGIASEYAPKHTGPQDEQPRLHISAVQPGFQERIHQAFEGVHEQFNEKVREGQLGIAQLAVSDVSNAIPRYTDGTLAATELAAEQIALSIRELLGLSTELNVSDTVNHLLASPTVAPKPAAQTRPSRSIVDNDTRDLIGHDEQARAHYIESVRRGQLGVAQSAAARISNSIPRYPDGRIVSPELAAEQVATGIKELFGLSASLKVATSVNALISKGSTGAGRSLATSGQLPRPVLRMARDTPEE